MSWQQALVAAQKAPQNSLPLNKKHPKKTEEK